MVSKKVILGNFLERRHLFESVLLDSPLLPVTVTTCADLMVVSGVESDSFDLCFGKVKLPQNPVLVEPVISYCFAVSAISQHQGYILRIVGETY